MNTKNRTIIVLAAGVAMAGLALTTPAGAAVIVDSNYVSGPVTGTLLAIDTTEVAGDDGHVANDGYAITLPGGGTTGDDSANPAPWEPDGSAAPHRRWMSVGSEATWTFNLPDDATILRVYPERLHGRTAAITRRFGN